MRRHFVWGVLGALVVVPAVRAEPLIALDFAFIDDGSVPAYGDNFDDGVLGPEWEVVDGSPGPETGSVLELNANDFIINTTPIAPQSDLIVGALLTENLSPGDFMFLVLFSQNREDFFAVGLTDQAVFATDENLQPLNIDGFTGPSVGFKLIYNPTTSTIIATANDTTIFEGNPNLDGGVAEVGILVVPEPAALPLLLFGTAWLMIHRRGSIH